jgi:hypothetical protein
LACAIGRQWEAMPWATTNLRLQIPQNRFCSPTDTTVSSTEFVGISEN